MHNLLAIIAVIFYALAAVYFSIKFFFKREKMRTVGFLFLFIGVFTHALTVLLTGLDYHRFPAATLTEAFSLVTLLAVSLFVIIARKSETDAAAVILVPISIAALLLNVLRGGSEQADIDPVLRGGWIYVHIPLMILSVAALSISFLMAVMYLIQEKQLKSKHPAFFYYRLPSLEVCDELSYRSLWFGFFLLTFGILTGMIWSKYLRGVFWSWDYKEIWAVITWILYAILLHGRMLSAWRGRKAAYLAILGFVFILFAFAGVSHIFKSYHSF
jgi:cytochrome c-type biogenesis protein CcsB